MSFSKPIKATRFNLAAKMNDLANSEVLEKSEDFYLEYAQNIDLFREKSLALRPGTSDLCGGFVWGDFHPVNDIDTASGVNIVGSNLGYDVLFPMNKAFSPFVTTIGHRGFIYIPSSGAASINSGKLKTTGWF